MLYVICMLLFWVIRHREYIYLSMCFWKSTLSIYLSWNWSLKSQPLNFQILTKMFSGPRQKKKQAKKKSLHQPLLWAPLALPHPTHAHTTPHAAGLRPRGDEPDQSDQSTEITVISQVRRGAPGHTEFTQPTHAGSEQIWPRIANIWHEKLRIHLRRADTSNFIQRFSRYTLKRLSAFQSSRTFDGSVYIDRMGGHRISNRAHIGRAFLFFETSDWAKGLP